jgi:hypothetical protein
MLSKPTTSSRHSKADGCPDKNNWNGRNNFSRGGSPLQSFFDGCSFLHHLGYDALSRKSA